MGSHYWMTPAEGDHFQVLSWAARRRDGEAREQLGCVRCQQKRGKTLDANRYATKKTVSQGMLDIALLTTNASQLKYLLQVKIFFFVMLIITTHCPYHKVTLQQTSTDIFNCEVGDGLGFYAVVLGLVIGSILLQVLVGVLFLILGGLDINDPDHQKTADILNNTATVVVFLITLLNVVISGFNIQHTETTVFDKIESLKIK